MALFGGFGDGEQVFVGEHSGAGQHRGCHFDRILRQLQDQAARGLGCVGEALGQFLTRILSGLFGQRGQQFVELARGGAAAVRRLLEEEIRDFTQQGPPALRGLLPGQFDQIVQLADDGHCPLPPIRDLSFPHAGKQSVSRGVQIVRYRAFFICVSTGSAGPQAGAARYRLVMLTMLHRLQRVDFARARRPFGCGLDPLDQIG